MAKIQEITEAAVVFEPIEECRVEGQRRDHILRAIRACRRTLEQVDSVVALAANEDRGN